MLWMKENSRAGKGDAKAAKRCGRKGRILYSAFGLHQLELFPIDTWIAKVEKCIITGIFQ